MLQIGRTCEDISGAIEAGDPDGSTWTVSSGPVACCVFGGRKMVTGVTVHAFNPFEVMIAAGSIVCLDEVRDASGKPVWVIISAGIDGRGMP